MSNQILTVELSAESLSSITKIVDGLKEAFQIAIDFITR